MTPQTHTLDIPDLIRRLEQGDRVALSRLLTVAGNPPESESLERSLKTPSQLLAPVIALTGSGGVGKSTLLGALTSHFARQGERVAVLACDPESPVTGGALLGDRCRIAGNESIDNVFVRSLSTPSGQQGVVRHIRLALLVLQKFGFNRIFVETVGAGQGDIAVREFADVLILILQPQTGDELQWEKAGILEIADVVVVHKGDLPAADRTVAEVSRQVNATTRPRTTVVKTSVVNQEGITELCRLIVELGEHVKDHHPKTTPQAEPSSAVLLEQIADYMIAPAEFSDEAWSTSRLCLLDSLGCGLLALDYPECTKLLGPVVPGAELPGGARVPGTSYELDPVTAAFNIGCQIRWLDYNDTWLAAEWGHPSDNFGGILAVADYLARKRNQRLTVHDILGNAIKAYEIQGVLALENAFNRVGLDHVLLVRVATTAVVTQMLGGSREHIIDAVSNAWLDGGALRTYRHAPNTGSRKSWAAGDATRRGVQLALWTMAGEMGYPEALSVPQWGFEDVVLGGRKLILPRALGSYVMENILFKVAFPAEFHAQTAAEAAIRLHPQIAERLAEVARIQIETQEPAVRIISKTGPLHNPADRDHCLQYIVAIALLHGELYANHYEAQAAADPRIDTLRERMEVVEVPRYSRDYLDPDKRSIANAVQVFFTDGTSTERVEVEYPLGHRRRRVEAMPRIFEKFQRNAETRFDSPRVEQLLDLFRDADRLDRLPVETFMEHFIP